MFSCNDLIQSTSSCDMTKTFISRMGTVTGNYHLHVTGEETISNLSAPKFHLRTWYHHPSPHSGESFRTHHTIQLITYQELLLKVENNSKYLPRTVRSYVTWLLCASVFTYDYSPLYSLGSSPMPFSLYPAYVKLIPASGPLQMLLSLPPCGCLFTSTEVSAYKSSTQNVLP